MKKKIWILNHYATTMYKNQAGRHYWFAKNLIEKGYEPTVFCATTFHNSDQIINIGNDKKLLDSIDNIPFVFVKTTPYSGNGAKRIKNMISFYRNLLSVSKEYAKIYGKPEVILASSVHPLTLVAGIKIAKKFGISCICEIRDLWPESIVEYGNLKKNTIIAKILYKGEKWIYKKADKLIFTMEGGKDYIVDMGWDKEHGGPIDKNKVYHINNGVDLEEFDYNKTNNIIDDPDLNNTNIFKVIYTGSIRKANNIELIIDAAKYINDNYEYPIKFLIWGDGDDRYMLEDKCKRQCIDNVVFKGEVDKKYIPYIVSNSDLNILNYSQHNIWKYGGSQNKNFEYLAAEKPILSTVTMGYDIITKYNAGISLENQHAENIAKAIINISNMEKGEYDLLCRNARSAAQEYDFRTLTDKLTSCIEDILK